MSHSNESLQKYTAIYRCSDDITNFKIRIKVREVDNLDEDDSNHWEQQIFFWQQKVFSKTEREFYRDEKNCVTDLEKKYHLDVLKTEEGTKLDLFSYVNDDDYVLRQEINSYFCKTSENDDGEYDYKKSIMAAAENPISYNYEFDAMFIMADFGEYVETSWIKYEKVLFVIKYNKKHKILSVYPDFTKLVPYFITVNGSITRKFQYFIDNVSEKMSEDEKQKETELFQKLNTRNVELVQQFHAKFLLPPKNKLQLHLLLEILWAKQFEYDTIYIQYFIDLPNDWFCPNKSQLQGITQASHAKGDEMLAHFGYVFDVVLEYDIEGLENKVPKCPYIYFEVISKDGWSRYRTEGLTYKNLPVAQPGNYTFELQCFRLIPDNISGQLRRFFIGDYGNCKDITWIGLPKDYKEPYLNKYGTNTVGTGQICLRMNVLQQSQAFLERYTNNSNKNVDIFDKLNSSSLVKSVEQVLQAFKRARKNMMIARKNL